MIRKLSLLAILAIITANVLADNVQTVTINGTTQSQTVKRITFNGDDIVLVFADDSQQTVDLTAVKINFVYDDVVNRVSFNADAPKVKEQTGVYNLNGQFMGNTRETLPKGIYIVDGRKEVVK